jgi:hypothetical protein
MRRSLIKPVNASTTRQLEVAQIQGLVGSCILNRTYSEVTLQRVIRDREKFKESFYSFFRTFLEANLPSTTLTESSAVTSTERIVFQHDMTRDGWKLANNQEKPTIGHVSYKPVGFLTSGENDVPGNILLDRAKRQNAMLNQFHAELLLRHTHQIPPEWRDCFLYVLFTGTIWEDERHRLRVPYISLRDGIEDLRFASLYEVAFDFRFGLMCPIRQS